MTELVMSSNCYVLGRNNYFMYTKKYSDSYLSGNIFNLNRRSFIKILLNSIISGEPLEQLRRKDKLPFIW